MLIGQRCQCPRHTGLAITGPLAEGAWPNGYTDAQKQDEAGWTVESSLVL